MNRNLKLKILFIQGLKQTGGDEFEKVIFLSSLHVCI